MKKIVFRAWSLVALMVLASGPVHCDEPQFQSLFNGHDLTGWSGRSEFWSVQDGVITGRTTAESPAPGNTFLIARDGDKNLQVENFELRLQYRVRADNPQGFANSGIQYRSIDRGDFVVAGYQADLEAGTTYSGILYDEAGGAGGRGIMAERGQRVVFSPDGQKQVSGQLRPSEEIQQAIKADDWNEYRIVARDGRLQHFINGMQTIDVVDANTQHSRSGGVLALQLHAGEPMTVQFKDLQLHVLDSREPAPADNVIVPRDFRLELLYTVPRDVEGSWVSMCVDPKGRLIVGDQYGKLYRLTPPPIGGTAIVQPETIDLEIGGAHGLLYAFDSLYVMKNEKGAHGLYRLLDTNGDDRFDKIELLRSLDAGGEHGAHSMVVSPDGKSLYVVVGNSSQLTEMSASRVPLHWGEDSLLPRIPTGFMDDSMAPQGWIARTDPDGKNWELIAMGMRNEFDLAFNQQGELFTYDADMEWDIGVPWYRPTRVNHVTSGAEFGFRNGSGKWPDYFLDSLGAVADVGPGSPTGIAFGFGAKFPAKYQQALFLCDWSFGKLRAVHLNPEGSSYVGEVEEFVSGQPLPVTDLVIHPLDGSMYFAVGGRNTQSALYRLTYIGGESTAPAVASTEFQEQRSQRHRLEAFHGHPDPAAIDAAWPFLASQDRALRFAARTALEWQDPQLWADRALRETNPQSAIAAVVALTRVSGKDEVHRLASDPAVDPSLLPQVIATLNKLRWDALTVNDQEDLLRAYSLAFVRLGRPAEGVRADLAGRLDAVFPAQERKLNVALANLLIYLQSPLAAGKIVPLLQQAPTQEEQIDYALALRTLTVGWNPDLREKYFRWFVSPAAAYRGGNTFVGSLRTIREQAIAGLSPTERAVLQPILDQVPVQESPQSLLAARKHVKNYALDELILLVEQGVKGGRDYDHGRSLFGAVACASCHRFDQEGGSVGPDLTAVAGRYSVKDLMESIVAPSTVISDQYAAIVVSTHDGKVISGRIANLNDDGLQIVENMLDPGNMTDVSRTEIEHMEPSKVSMMPEGLLNSLQVDEIQDLIGYLLARGNRQHAMFQQATARK